MLPGTTGHVVESLIEAYAILFTRLVESVHGLFNALGLVLLYLLVTALFPVLCFAIRFKCLSDSVDDLINAMKLITLHLFVAAVFPIVCLSATFYIIVTSLIGVTSWPFFIIVASLMDVMTGQELEPDIARTVAEQQCNEAFAVNVGRSLADISNGSSKSTMGVKKDRHVRFLSTDLLPPAIPSHLKDCDFFYNTADMDLVDNSTLLLKGKLRQVRLTMDGQHIWCSVKKPKMVLKKCERRGVRGESKRGRLELGSRVYAGPAEWLVRVLKEEA